MIKFALRRNLIYPLQLIIYNLLRKLETILINHLFNISDSLAFTPLMFIGEFAAGLFVYLYEKNFLKKKKNKSKFFSIELIQEEGKINQPDNPFKIYLLIFFVASFDWVQFSIWNANVPKFKTLSNSLVSRLSVVITMTDALFYIYVLRLPIFKHQLFSIIITVICFVIIVITEFFFQEINYFFPYTTFVLALATTIVCQILSGLIDSIENYLYEYDFFNPYYTLMLEGLFGFFISFLFFFTPKYLVDVINIYKSFDAKNLVLFTFLLILYIILCGGRNLYRVITTKLYTPMARSLTDYFLNPIYMSVDFAIKQDFLRNGERNIAYFVTNLILSILLSFCGCVYNEFIVLFFWGLEHNTHGVVTQRAMTENELNSVTDDDED